MTRGPRSVARLARPPRSWQRSSRRCRLTVVIALLAPAALAASDRLVRQLASDQGLPAPSTYALAQDQAGLLWIGTEGGLFRYDGGEMRRWAPRQLVSRVEGLAAGPSGALVARTDEGALYRVTEAGAEPLPGPGGALLTGVEGESFDRRGRLWVVLADRLLRWDGDGWRLVASDLPGGSRLRRLAAAGEGAYVADERALFWLPPDGAPAHLADLDDAVFLLPRHDGGLVALTFSGEVFQLDSRGLERLFAIDARAISAVERGEALWVSFDRYLVRLRPGEAPEVLGVGEGIEGGGPLLVDGEGSLWLGTYTGLFQFPEPETQVFAERHGLPSSHTRSVLAAEGAIWVATWQGVGRIDRTPEGWRARAVERGAGRGLPCRDRRHRPWVETGNGRVRPFRPTVDRHPYQGLYRREFCATGPDGALWIGSQRQGLLRAAAAGATLEPVGVPFGDGEEVSVGPVMVDSSGRLWVAGWDVLCSRPLGERADRDAGWSCARPAGMHNPTDLIELPSGHLWLSTNGAGMFRRQDGRWEPIPGSRELPSRSISGLAPSPRGGVWILGHGVVARFAERPESAEGWRRVETLGTWQGLPTSSANQLLEEPDGTLWVATSLGVVRIPAAARAPPRQPPPVTLVDALADGERLPIAGVAELPYRRNRLELRFAAPSYRDPARLRYQVRHSTTAPWSDAVRQPLFRFVDLPPGRYQAEVRASLDGRRWSEPPARFAFLVRPPWYRQAWALALFTVTAAAAAVAVHRARVAVLLRLERQRTRIAMDLHDQLGSGLASIGILAGVLDGDPIEEQELRRLAAEIGATAEELGAALGEIVWSLRRGAGTLEELAHRLAATGARLCASHDLDFDAALPAAWPPGEVPLPVRRHVLLIGLEALHNAARHARARSIRLSLEADGDGWLLAIADDGIGLTAEGPRGVGLDSMRRRAAAIGAEIRWRPLTGGGTLVELSFRAAPRRRWRTASLPRTSRPR